MHWSGVEDYGLGETTGISTQRLRGDTTQAVYCLLGKLWHAYDDIKKAVDCYVESLKLNPFMWDAFTGLCDTGRSAAGGCKCSVILMDFCRCQYSDTKHFQNDSRNDSFPLTSIRLTSPF